MGLRDSRGNQISTQRGVKELAMQFVESLRRRFKVKLETFWAKCLLPANGIKLSTRDIDMQFPPLKFEASEEYMRAVELGRKTGMFKDRNEIRKASQAIWNWIEPVDEKDNAKVDFQMPVQTSSGGGLFGGSRSQAQTTRQKVKPVVSTTTP